jgi:hypothetical protein
MDMPVHWHYQCVHDVEKTYLTTGHNKVKQITNWCMHTYGEQEFRHSWRAYMQESYKQLLIEFTQYDDAVTFELTWSDT